MICYKCNTEGQRGIRCQICGADLSFIRKAHHISNVYYNEALKMAEVRNLSGAVGELRKSLKFNKYNKDARNLLGLIFYEMGEIVEALGEWVISVNYHPTGNLASRYLDEIHANKAQLDSVNQTIKKYNLALSYCKQGSRDLAMIQLKKVLSLNPRLVKGHQLLALIYMQENQLERAQRELRSAAKIDANNTLTMRYMKEVNGLLKAKGAKRKKQDDLISYQSGNETIIMPKRFQESSIGASLVYILIGLLVGTAVTAFLIVPAVQNSAREDARRQLIDASDTISTNGRTIADLESQIESLQEKLETAKAQSAEVQTQFSSYEELLKAFQIYSSGDVLAAGKALDKIDTSYLSDEAKKTFESINNDIYGKYMDALYDEGYAYYTRHEYDKAIKDLSKVAKHDIDFKDGNAAYYLAQAYNRNGQLDKAKKYYKFVIENHPGTQRARTSLNYVDAQD